jgi:hypothetical protein
MCSTPALLQRQYGPATSGKDVDPIFIQPVLINLSSPVADVISMERKAGPLLSRKTKKIEPTVSSLALRKIRY